MINTDILIIGGGIAGSALAVNLGQSQWDVILLDKKTPATTQSKQITGRVCAIHLASKQFLQQCGAWPFIADSARAPMTEMHVWDKPTNTRIDFDSADLGTQAMAYIINNQNLIAALWQRINELPSVTSQTGHTITQITQHSDHVIAELDNGQRIKARLIVGADGGQSWLRNHLNISIHEKSYQQHAVVTVVRTEKPHQFAAWQTFLTSGPIGLLPLANPHQCAVVWSTTPQQANTLTQHTTEKFNHAINQAFTDHALGQLHCELTPIAFPLIERHIEHYVDERIAFIGDAAHTIHPLAGQGANLGLMDARALTHVLNQARVRHADIGKKHSLRPYERARRSDNQCMMDLMRCFNTIFASPNPWLQTLIKTGLPLINYTTSIKQTMMKIAAGNFSSVN